MSHIGHDDRDLESLRNVFFNSTLMRLIAPEDFTSFIRRGSIYIVYIYNDAKFIPFILLFMLFVDKSIINYLDTQF
jgi:hypothetical protein